MSAMRKPVKLQVNTSGAWRDVIGFDAADDVQSCEVMDAAAPFRVVIPNVDAPRSPIVLTRWSPEAGWRQEP
jgi:hypothetical protein